MGGSAGAAPNMRRQTNQTMEAYARWLPEILRLTSEAQPGIDRTQAQSALNVLDEFGRPISRVSQEIQDANAQAGARTVGGLITGQGGQNIRDAETLARETNPEFYSNRENASRRANDLLNSINLSGLSPGEAAAVERSLNQTNTRSGNLGLINPMNVVQNAMQFGDRMSQKRAELSGAIGTANSLAPANAMSLSGQTMQGATFQPPTSTSTNFGLSSLPLGGSQAYSGGQQTMGNLFGLQGTLSPLQWQANQNNSAQGIAESFGKQVNCCFIFLECLNGKLPWYVRVERDKYYSKEPRIATGYKKMAKWLVPLMQQNNLIKRFINWSMVKPITLYGGWLHKENGFGFVYRPVKSFWFMVWRFI